MTLTKSLVGLSLLVVGLASLQGCAHEDEQPAALEADGYDTPMAPHFNPAAVNVDQSFADAAVVKADRIVVPSTQPGVSKIVVGTILASDRSSKPIDADDNTNPMGFLRRVTKIDHDGANTVLTTEPCRLTDWMEGDIDFSDESLFAHAAPKAEIHTQANQPKGKSQVIKPNDSVLDSTQVSGKSTFKFSKAHFTLGGKLDGYMKIRTHDVGWGWASVGVPVGVEGKVLLTLDPSVSADIEASVAAGAGTYEKTWTPGKIVRIRVPAGPIPLTLSFTPVVTCSVTANGSASTTVHAEISTHAALGYKGSVGVGYFHHTDLSEAPTTPQVKFTVYSKANAAMTASCSIHVKPELAAFEYATISMEMGPTIALTAEACAAAKITSKVAAANFSLAEQHWFDITNIKAGVAVDVWKLHIDESVSIDGIKIGMSKPNYLVGNDASCELSAAAKAKAGDDEGDAFPNMADSCDHQPDGFYCSTVELNAGFYCQDQQVLEGRQCDSLQLCAGGSKDAIKCQ